MRQVSTNWLPHTSSQLGWNRNWSTCSIRIQTKREIGDGISKFDCIFWDGGEACWRCFSDRTRKKGVDVRDVRWGTLVFCAEVWWRYLLRCPCIMVLDRGQQCRYFWGLLWSFLFAQKSHDDIFWDHIGARCRCFGIGRVIMMTIFW